MAVDKGIPVYDKPVDVQSLIDEINGYLPHLKEAAGF
jgi:hypothetical protein